MELKYSLQDFDGHKIISKYGMEKDGNLHLFFADSCFRRMHKYVPFDTGTLASHATVRPGSVTYEERYAYYQYRGYTKGEVKHYSNNSNGLRGKYWDKKMIANERDVLTREVENEAKRLKGSR